MLKLAQASDVPALIRFCERDIYGARISTVLSAYGTDCPFASVWYESGEDGEIVAAVSRFDSFLTLCAAENADFGEIGSFIRAVGARNVYTDIRCAESMGFTVTRRGAVMKYMPSRAAAPTGEVAVPTGEVTAPTTPTGKVANPTGAVEVYEADSENIKELYYVIHSFEKRVPVSESFGAWLVDVSHRMRHGLLRAVAARNITTSESVSVALTSALSEKTAVIGSVATLPEYRRRGLAGAVTGNLAKKLISDGKEVYLCRTGEKTRKLYERLGFADCGEWAICDFD